MVATGCTPFGKHTALSISQLAGQVIDALIDDLGGDDATDVDSVWFGSSFMDAWGQPNIRGHAALAPVIEAGKLAQRVPITNVEAACSTGSVAFRGAVLEVRSGAAEVAAAVGVEKMHLTGQAQEGRDIFSLLAGCAERLDTGRLTRTYEEAALAAGRKWLINPNVSMFLETYAVQAQLHMNKFGVAPEQVAAGCAKTHNYAAQNPLAQYRFPMTLEQVLADRPVTPPFTRAMCAPISDGAAAAVVCSGDWLLKQDPSVQARAIRVRGLGMSSGTYARRPDAPTLSRTAARRAFAEAGLKPADVDLIEVHDATAYGEILQLEMLELCGPGEAAKFVAAGETGPGGKLPVNTSGGLVAKGHPVAATGLSMIHELATQLRHEAGPRQVEGADVALAENGGGVLGLEEAACVVTILERPA